MLKSSSSHLGILNLGKGRPNLMIKFKRAIGVIAATAVAATALVAGSSAANANFT
jgi:hypothetical protein